jgi:hypothetical protein
MRILRLTCGTITVRGILGRQAKDTASIFKTRPILLDETFRHLLGTGDRQLPQPRALIGRDYVFGILPNIGGFLLPKGKASAVVQHVKRHCFRGKVASLLGSAPSHHREIASHGLSYDRVTLFNITYSREIVI